MSNTSRPPVASLIISWNLPSGGSTDQYSGVAPLSTANVQVITSSGAGLVDGVGVCCGVVTGGEVGVGVAAVHPTIHKAAIKTRVKGMLTSLCFIVFLQPPLVIFSDYLESCVLKGQHNFPSRKRHN